MKHKIFSIYMGLVTFCMFCAMIACQKLYKYENLKWEIKDIAGVVIPSLIIGCVAGIIVNYLSAIKKEKRVVAQDNIPVGKMFLISISIMLVFWLPGFLAYYPGICAYDFQPQIYQIYYEGYNDHHPLIHTLMIEAFWRMGQKCLGSDIAGIAMYTIVQMVTMALVFSLTVVSLAKHFKSKKLGMVLIALFTFYPFHFYLSISVTKDIYFSLGMLLSALSLFLVLSKKENTWKPGLWDGILVVALLIVMLFRNNGRYGVLFLLGASCIILMVYKGKRKLIARIGTEVMVACAAGLVCLNILSSATNATGGDKREMLSLPAQQIARVVHYHKDDLADETIKRIETVIWPSALYYYRPDIADPVKKDVISYEVLHYPKVYAGLYLDLFREYPSEYINAFLALYAGFLNPLDVSCNYINDEGEGVPDGLYYIQTVFYEEDMAKFGIKQMPVFPMLHKWMEAFANGTAFQKIPFLNIIMVPGIFLWAYLYLFGINVCRHGKKYILPYALIGGYFLTLFAGPTVQLRYIYPVMVCLPVAIAFVLQSKTEEYKKSDA